MLEDNLSKSKTAVKLKLLGLTILLVVLGVPATVYLLKYQNHSPVPANFQKAVNFPVYYPDPKKLPPGYRLNTDSFANPLPNGIAYSVGYDNGKKLVFSLQPKPSDTELQSFYGSYIPLKVDIQTALGQAEIGAYHQQTLVSLPVVNGPWIIITAPANINQAQLKQVVNSLKK